MAKKLSLISLFIAALTVVGMAAFTGAAWAEEKGSGDAGELAKQSQNPVSTLISVPFENNATFNNGPEDAYVNILNIKPVIPMSLTENWNLINRAIVPVIYQDERFPAKGTCSAWGTSPTRGLFHRQSPATSSGESGLSWACPPAWTV